MMTWLYVAVPFAGTGFAFLPFSVTV